MRRWIHHLRDLGDDGLRVERCALEALIDLRPARCGLAAQESPDPVQIDVEVHGHPSVAWTPPHVKRVRQQQSQEVLPGAGTPAPRAARLAQVLLGVRDSSIMRSSSSPRS